MLLSLGYTAHTPAFTADSHSPKNHRNRPPLLPEDSVVHPADSRHWHSLLACRGHSQRRGQEAGRTRRQVRVRTAARRGDNQQVRPDARTGRTRS